MIYSSFIFSLFSHFLSFLSFSLFSLFFLSLFLRSPRTNGDGSLGLPSCAEVCDLHMKIAPDRKKRENIWKHMAYFIIKVFLSFSAFSSSKREKERKNFYHNFIIKVNILNIFKQRTCF